MKPRVYIETSVISYLTSRETRKIPAAAWRQATLDWWNYQRLRFDLFTSELVVEESEQGHPEAAQRRVAALADIPRLSVLRGVSELADALLKRGRSSGGGIG